MDLDRRDDVLSFAFFSPSAPETHSCSACTAPAEHIFPLLDFTEALQLSSSFFAKNKTNNSFITFRVKLVPAEHAENSNGTII